MPESFASCTIMKQRRSVCGKDIKPAGSPEHESQKEWISDLRILADDQLLDAVAQAREHFAGKIRAARKEDFVDDC